MRALSSTEVKIDNLDDELQFTMLRKKGWIEILLGPSALVAFAATAVLQHGYLSLCCCLVGIGVLAINWMQGAVTVFRVSGRRLTATGNLRRWSASDVSIAASEIKSIAWSCGGDVRPSGIYVWHGHYSLKSTCVLPDLSSEKSQNVTDAIKAQFPQFIGDSASILSISLELGH